MPTNIFNIDTEISGKLTVSGTSDFIISSTGNVGIGTTSPIGKLDVANDGLFLTSTNTSSRNWLVAGNYLAFGDFALVQSDAFGTDPYPPANSTPRLYISTAGNVGIGTTSPSYKLDVSGSSASVANLYSTGYTNLDIVSTRTSGNIGGVRFKQSADTYISTEINAVVDGGLEIKTGNGSTAPVTHFKVDASGNVGIGTTSPSEKLHVTGNGLFTGGIYVNNTAAYIWNATNGVIRFGTNNTERARITSDGNVGIGTTDPNEELEVKSASFTTIAVNTDRNTAGENIGSFAFYGHNNATTPENIWYTRIMSSMTDVTDGSENGDIFFQQLNDGAGSETFRVKSSGEIQFPAYGAGYLRTDASGNVIVDVSTVEDTLDTVTTRNNATTNSIVVGGVGSSGEIALYSTGTADATNTEYDSHVLRFSTSGWDTNNSVARPVHWNVRSEASSNIYPDAYLTFYEENISYNHWKLKLPGRGSGSSYIHPDAALFNGNVIVYESDTSNANIKLTPAGDSYFANNLGIGTTSPGGKLHIQTDADSEFIFTGASTSGYATTFHMDNTGLDIGHNSTGRALNLKTGSLDRLTISGSGNVGIGTTSPTQKLDVVGNIVIPQGNFLSFRRSGVDNPILWQGNGSFGSADQLYLRQPNNNNLHFQTNGGNTRMLITGGGNVGIGTTSPWTKLVLDGDPQAGTANAGVVLAFDGGDYAEYGYRFKANGANYYQVLYDGSSINWKNYAGGASYTTRMSLTNGGNLGIGTTSPAAKLHVAGDGIFGDVSVGAISGQGIGLQGPFDSIIAYDPVSLWTRIGGGALSFNPITAEFTFNSEDVLFGSLSIGAIPVKAPLGVSDSGIVSDFPPFEVLRISSSSNVGIGITNPSEKLHVDGNILASGDITAFSDARIKENVETLPNALESIKAMRGVTYNKIGEEKQSIGVIAQEVQAVLPQLVSEHNDGMLSVAYGNVTAVLIEAIKELTSEVESLKAQLNASSK